MARVAGKAQEPKTIEASRIHGHWSTPPCPTVQDLQNGGRWPRKLCRCKGICGLNDEGRWSSYVYGSFECLEVFREASHQTSTCRVDGVWRLASHAQLEGNTQ